jgi:hypothetical protein
MLKDRDVEASDISIIPASRRAARYTMSVARWYTSWKYLHSDENAMSPLTSRNVRIFSKTSCGISWKVILGDPEALVLFRLSTSIMAGAISLSIQVASEKILIHTFARLSGAVVNHKKQARKVAGVPGLIVGREDGSTRGRSSPWGPYILMGSQCRDITLEGVSLNS